MGEEKNSEERSAEFKELDYQTARLMIKDGDILLFKGKSIKSRIIEWLTQSEYSHAAVAVWWGEQLMVIEAIWRGVIVDPLQRSIRRYKGSVDWWRLKKELEPDERAQLVKFALMQLSKGYAFWRIARFLWRIIEFYIKGLFEQDRSVAKKYFCSQFVSATYNQIGIDLCPENSDWFTSAGDIAKSTKIKYQETLDKKFLQSLQSQRQLPDESFSFPFLLVVDHLVKTPRTATPA